MTKLIIPCLWFDGQALDAANFYTSIFEDSGIDNISYYGKEGFEIHGHLEGTVLTVSFHLRGQQYTALNGGPDFKFSEAVSLQVFCKDQDEIDYYWERLGEGGQKGPCGWLKDKFGFSWQIIPNMLDDILSQKDKADRVMKAFLQMSKIEIDTLLNS